MKIIDNTQFLIKKGQNANKNTDYHRSLKYYFNAISLCKKDVFINKSLCVKIYNSIGENYNTIGVYDNALKYYNKALKIFKNSSEVKYEDIANTYSGLADVFYNNGNYKKALSFNRSAYRIRKQHLGKKHQDTIMILNDFGNIYLILGVHKKAKKYFQNAFKISKDVFGLNHKNVAISLNGLGLVYSSIGSHNKAIDVYTQAISIYEYLFGEKHPETATVYQNLALSYYYIASYDISITYTKKVLKIRNNVFGMRHNEVADSLNALGLCYFAVDSYDEAFEAFNKALVIYEDILGTNHYSIAITYYNLVRFHYRLGSYDKALLLAKKALKIFKDVFGLNHEYTAMAYESLGMIYTILGSYEKALNNYNKSLEIYTQIGITENANIAYIYDGMGNIHFFAMSAKQSLQYFNNALKIKKKIFNEYSEAIATSYYNLGLVHYYKLSSTDKSLQYFEKALNIYKKVYNNMHPYVATTYNMLAHVYLSLNSNKKSLKYSKKALKIRKNVLGKNHYETATSYHALGEFYHNSGSYNKALFHYKKALKIVEKIFGKYHHSTATGYSSIGVIYENLNLQKKSLNYLYKSLKIRKKILQDDHPDLAYSYRNIAIVEYQFKNYKEAYFNHLKASSLQQNISQVIFSISDKQTKILHLEDNIIDNYYLLHIAFMYIKSLEILKKKENFNIFKAIGQIYEIFLQEKGSFQDEETFLGIIYSNTKDQNLKEKIENLKGLKYQYAKLLNDMTGDESEKQRINALKKKISKLEQYLSEHIQRFKQETEFDTITHKDIAKDLKEDELFIDFAEGEKNYYFFTLNHKAKLEFVEISQEDTEKIQKNITLFRENIKERIESTNKNEISEIEKESTEILKVLYDLLIDKYLKEHIKDYKTLTIAPDGRLNLLPFDALYDGQEYLLNTKEIYYISSGRELIRINKFGLSDKEAQEKIVVFANPDYDYEQETSSSSDENENSDDTEDFRNTRAVTKFTNCKPLPWTKEEANVIKQIYTEKSRIYLEKAANEKHFKEATDAHILHISTHGIVVQNDEEKEPLLKIALALTGYNTSIKEQKDYGVMTGLKIASLDLNQTELVILSACETAIGESDNVIGVSSLSRAFIIAGAKSTIASLWEIEDKSTKEFFELFYHKIQTQTNYAIAFKETQREMYHKLKSTKNHPLYWAGFAFFGSV